MINFTVFFRLLLLITVYYMIGYIIRKYYPFDTNNLYLFFIIYRDILTTLFIIAILQYSSIRSEWEKVYMFPRINYDSYLYKILFIYFLFISLLTYYQLIYHIDEIIKEQPMMLYFLRNKYYFKISFLIVSELYAILGEELVFRYFAINTLNSFLRNKTLTILICSVVWSLIHDPINIHLFFLGILLGYCYIITGYLSLSIFLHFIYNMIYYIPSIYVYLSKSEIYNISPLLVSLAIFLSMIFLFHLCGMILRPKIQNA